MSDREFDEAETRVLERLRFLGNGANILSFGRDTGVLDRLIRRGYLREVRMFGVEFSPTPPAVQKTDANPSPSEAPPASRPKTVPSPAVSANLSSRDSKPSAIEARQSQGGSSSFWNGPALRRSGR